MERMDFGDEYENYDGKYRPLIIGGVPVTPEQAREIRVRTSDPLRLMHYPVGRILGIEYVQGAEDPLCAAIELREQMQIVEAYHLDANITNDRRQTWLHKNGTISNWWLPVGKWTHDEDIHQEWSRIAEAFPFLDLRCQAVNPREGLPEVEWVVKDGFCFQKQPTEWLEPPARPYAEELNELYARFDRGEVEKEEIRAFFDKPNPQAMAYEILTVIEELEARHA